MATAPSGDRSGVTVLALLAAYNEEDIVGQIVADLLRQQVQVYFIDDGSTDSTVAQVEPWLGHGVVAIERRERAATSSWAALLRHKAELAQRLAADWFIHQDADEIRESPWEGLSLRDAIARVDRLGYNAIDFHALDFWPIDESWKAGDDPRRALPHWAPCQPHDKVRINAWKKTPGQVDLVSSGGHEARFPGRRVFPLRFLMRHYAIRSQAHGERKIFADRLPRLGAEGRERGWNVHYEWYAPGDSFLRDPATLTRFDQESVLAGLVLRHRGVEELEAALAAAGGEPPSVTARVAEVEGLLAAERERADELSRQLDTRNHELLRAEEELQRSRGEAARADAELRDVLASRSWRWTAPVRRLLRAAGLG